jgi:Ca2+-binding EF-hand superfamily protein
MNRSIRYTLLAGAVVVAGIGTTGAAMQSHPQAHGQNTSQAKPGGHGRGGQRFLSEYDLNHDGKVTRDEFNKATAQRFSEAAGGAKVMTEKQFEAFRTRTLHQHADQSFRRADWNGDGKLSFDEFANPIRASFERADKQSTGTVYCQHKAQTRSAPKQGRRSRGGSRGAGGLCSHDDLNHDGKVTRSELDQALHQQFAAAGKGGALTKDQFEGMQHSRAEASSGRAFARLDSNHDGKLSLQEFSAYQQRTFDRMDRNHDGTITSDEMTSRRRYAGRSASRG